MALKYQGNLLKESNQGVNRPNRYRLDTVVELEAGRTYTFDMDGWTGGGDWVTTFEVELTNGQHTTTVQARNYSRGLYTATFNAPHTITHVYITNERTKTNNWNSRLEWATLVEGTAKQTWWSAPLDNPIVELEGNIIADKIYWGSRELARVYLGEQLVWGLQSGPEPIIISSATVGIHPNYIWIESRQLSDIKDTIEGNIQKVVLDDKVTIEQPFEYDRWNSFIIQLEGHPDNPTIYKEVRSALGPQDAFSGVKVSIYPIEQLEDISTLTGLFLDTMAADWAEVVYLKNEMLLNHGVEPQQVIGFRRTGDSDFIGLTFVQMLGNDKAAYFAESGHSFNIRTSESIDLLIDG